MAVVDRELALPAGALDLPDWCRHRAPHSWVEHIRLVDAIEAGDVDEAELAARSHVDAASAAALDGAANLG